MLAMAVALKINSSRSFSNVLPFDIGTVLSVVAQRAGFCQT
jgi:hypothetical protein